MRWQPMTCSLQNLPRCSTNCTHHENDNFRNWGKSSQSRHQLPLKHTTKAKQKTVLHSPWTSQVVYCKCLLSALSSVSDVHKEHTKKLFALPRLRRWLQNARNQTATYCNQTSQRKKVFYSKTDRASIFTRKHKHYIW